MISQGDQAQLPQYIFHLHYIHLCNVENVRLEPRYGIYITSMVSYSDTIDK